MWISLTRAARCQSHSSKTSYTNVSDISSVVKFLYEMARLEVKMGMKERERERDSACLRISAVGVSSEGMHSANTKLKRHVTHPRPSLQLSSPWNHTATNWPLCPSRATYSALFFNPWTCSILQNTTLDRYLAYTLVLMNCWEVRRCVGFLVYFVFEYTFYQRRM